MGRASAEVSNSRPLLGPGAAQLRAMGLWRPGRSLLHSLAAALMLACLAWVSATAALRLLIHPPAELEEVALCSFIATICTGFTIKAALFIGQGATLHRLIDLLSAARRQHSNGKSNEDIRDSYQKLSSRLYHYMQGCVVPALIGWTFFPLVSRALNDSGEESPGAVADWQFPVPHWVPVDMQRSPTYHLLYVLQSFCLLVASQSTIAVDLFFIHMMLMVAAEIEVLSENVSAMGKIDSGLVALDDEDCGPSTKYLLSYRDGNGRISEISRKDDISEDQVRALLVKNVQHHQTILQAVGLLQDAMDISIVILLFTNMADLCSCMFASAILLQRGGNAAKALKPLMTIPPCFYETAIYCFFGNIVTEKSEQLVTAAWSCGWPLCGSGFRRGLLLFLTEAARPVEITVGKTFKLSKQMLLQVLNGSYALLNLLYSIR